MNEKELAMCSAWEKYVAIEKSAFEEYVATKKAIEDAPQRIIWLEINKGLIKAIERVDLVNYKTDEYDNLSHENAILMAEAIIEFLED